MIECEECEGYGQDLDGNWCEQCDGAGERDDDSDWAD